MLKKGTIQRACSVTKCLGANKPAYVSLSLSLTHSLIHTHTHTGWKIDGVFVYCRACALCRPASILRRTIEQLEPQSSVVESQSVVADIVELGSIIIELGLMF